MEIDKAQLQDILNTYFNEHELQEMMFNLRIDYEDLAGNSRTGTVRELIGYMQRRDRLGEVVDYIQTERPTIHFEDGGFDVDISQEVSSTFEGKKIGIAIDEIRENASAEYINQKLAEENIEVTPLREAKMILVGEGGVGKTSLVKRLVNDDYDPNEPMTKGISIEEWQIPIADPDDGEVEVTLNIWDFGGQGIYQATHQLFFTKRSLYLFVIDARQGTDAGLLDYWLKLIQTFGEDAPILVVVNKIDILPIKLPERQLMRDYENIAGFAYISCETGVGIDELRNAIYKTVSTLDHIHDKFFATWFEVKAKLEGLKKEDKDYISMDRYIEICEEAGVTERNDQDVLLSSLHDLGTVLSFKDDKSTADTQVLNPDWITEGIYAILSAREIQESEGVLRLDQLDSILDATQFPEWKHKFIVDTMIRFELCHQLDLFGDKFLIPSLLSAIEPEIDWDFTNAISLQFKYEIIPNSVVTRFIIRMMNQIDPGKSEFWLTGAKIQYENNQAYIAAGKNEISIWVNGPTTTRRQLLSIIRAQLKEINRSFPNLKVEEVVPIPGYPNHTITYRELRNLEERNVPMPYYYPAIDDNIDIRVLLDGIEIAQERNRTKIRELMKKAFNGAEFKLLCQDLPNIDYDDLPGETREIRMMELIEKMHRNGRIPELIAFLKDRREDVEW
ncbi:MAG: COR domain-containing protein [Chloroflexota bacterium]